MDQLAHLRGQHHVREVQPAVLVVVAEVCLFLARLLVAAHLNANYGPTGTRGPLQPTPSPQPQQIPGAPPQALTFPLPLRMRHPKANQFRTIISPPITKTGAQIGR